jgi:hypothetical protein
MRRFRQGALVFGLLAVQLSMASDGLACTRTAGGRAAASQAMSGMDMPKGAATGHSMDGATAPTDQSPEPQKMPCDGSHSPLPCQGSGSCVVPFVATPVAGVMSAPATHDALTTIVALPASLTLAPELPPPRA